MSCNCMIEKFRQNDGLLCEPQLTALEGKETIAADFADRVRTTAALPDGDAKKAAAFALYEQSQATPVTEDRIQDPTDLQKIVEWSPSVLSPFTYNCEPERLKRNTAAAYAILEAAPQGKIVAFVRAFAQQHGCDFTQDEVLAYLKAHRDALPCNAMQVAVINADAGKSAAQTAAYANPYRADADCLAVGAVFGLEAAAKPDVAAKAAMTFASVCFLKAGVYGAMWMASMLAHAIVIDEPEVYIVRALTSFPVPSVFFRKVSWMQRNLNCRVDWEGCRDELRSKWCENDSPFALRSVYTNAMAIAASLLYAQPDSGKALDYITQCGLQKELNTAYVKAVLAMIR